VALLSQVAEDAEEYATAQARLGEAQQQQDLANKYHRVRQLMDEGQWQPALALIGEIRTVDASYRDVRALARAVRTQQARERSLEVLYGQVQEALAAAQWERALDLLRRLHELNADYQDVGVLLAHHEHLSTLHDRAVEAMGQHKWAVATTLLNQIKALEPEYKNVDELIARVQVGLDAEAELAELYDRAKAAMALENWSEALDLLQQLDKQRAGFRDVRQLLATVQGRTTIPCWRCGHPVPPGRKFCGKCGAPRKKPTRLTWTCWRCGAQVAASRKFCGKCGAPREKPRTVICPKCGRENSADRKFCVGCGTSLGSADEPD
jgi:tetratricopeptide (TPR) repeat protein